MEVTQWFTRHTPVHHGWYDTVEYRFPNGDVEIRLWWDGKEWKASPYSPSNGKFGRLRNWRGMIKD